MTIDTKRLVFPTVTAKAGSDVPEPELLITTADQDRQRDRIDPAGIRLDAYLKNPVVMFGHDLDELPVGTTTQLTLEPGRGLRAKFRWLEGDERAARVRNAFEQGMLRGASVGFRTIDATRNSDGGYDFQAVELVEWSLVPVPANPYAVRQLKALGLDVKGPKPQHGATTSGPREQDGATSSVDALHVEDCPMGQECPMRSTMGRSAAHEPITILGVGTVSAYELADAVRRALRQKLQDAVEEGVGTAVTALTGKLYDPPDRREKTVDLDIDSLDDDDALNVDPEEVRRQVKRRLAAEIKAHLKRMSR